MALLKKDNIPAPVLPKEVVEVAELGGDVVVRGLLLKDRLSLFKAADDGAAHVSKLLSATVIDADDQPVYSEQQWEEFGSKNFAAVLRLFDVARRLSGLQAEVATKN